MGKSRHQSEVGWLYNAHSNRFVRQVVARIERRNDFEKVILDSMIRNMGGFPVLELSGNWGSFAEITSLDWCLVSC